MATLGDEGKLAALCHVGANVVPSGEGCEAFARPAAEGQSRMIIGEQGAVTALWEAARKRPPEAAPGPARAARVRNRLAAARRGRAGCARRRPTISTGSCRRARPRTRSSSAGDPLARDGEGFRWRTLAQIEEGRSWVWLEGGVVRFKAEASAWTPSAVQLQQVWVDPAARGRGDGARGLRDLCRLLLATTPVVTLFVRKREHGRERRSTMQSACVTLLEYRSVLF